MAYLHDHTYSMSWLDWMNRNIKSEDVDIGFSNSMITDLHEQSLDIEESNVLTTVKKEPMSDDEGIAEQILPKRCIQKRIGDDNATDIALQHHGFNHSHGDVETATNNKSGSRKRNMSPANQESKEKRPKKNKSPPRLYCSVCKDTIYSKNMARHRKSKGHILNEKREQGPKHPCIKVIKIPETLLPKFLPSNKIEPFKKGLLDEGYILQYK